MFRAKVWGWEIHTSGYPRPEPLVIETSTYREAINLICGKLKSFGASRAKFQRIDVNGEAIGRPETVIVRWGSSASTMFQRRA